MYASPDTRPTMRQIICWDWIEGREVCVARRFKQPEESVRRVGDRWQVEWGNRFVQAVSYREFHSEYGRELAARSDLAAELRRGKDWK